MYKRNRPSLKDIIEVERIKRIYNRRVLEKRAIRLGMDKDEATKLSTKTTLAFYIVKREKGQGLKR